MAIIQESAGRSLTINELRKFRDIEFDGIVKFASRAELLKWLIDTNSKIELIDDSTVELDPSNNARVLEALSQYISTKDEIFLNVFKRGQVYASVIYTTTGHPFRLCDIKKTNIFGSGAGTNSGTLQTKIQEIGQAIILGISSVLNKRELLETDLTPDNVRCGSRYVVPCSEQDITDVLVLLNNKSWRTGLLSAANALLQSLDLSGKIFYHQKSDWVKNLQQMVMDINAKDQNGPFTNTNKWNPSDIWAVDSGTVLPTCSTFEELNNMLLKLFHRNIVIGLSLKKVSKTPHVSVHNDGSDQNKTERMMQGLILSKSNELEHLFQSKHTYMEYSDMFKTKNTIQYRSFNSDQQIQGEIQGSTALHGKVGFGMINVVLKKLTGKTVTKRQDILNKMKTPDGFTKTIDKIVEMASCTMGVPYPTDEAMANFYEMAATKDPDYIRSKYQAVQLVYIVDQFSRTNPELAHKFVNELFAYASSTTDLSSVFVKVS